MCERMRTGVNSVKTAHLYLIPTSDEDAEHTIRRAAALRPTLDHTIIYVAGKNLKLRPFYAHEIGQKGVNSVKTAHLNLIPTSDEDAEHTVGRAAALRPTMDHTVLHTHISLSVYEHVVHLSGPVRDSFVLILHVFEMLVL
jgi:hypothetical protein